MPTFTDQLGRAIFLPHVPQRIISLVPSQTELLYTLGLGQETIGITKFCVRPPEWFLTKTRIGGTKDIRHEKIRELRPDLILANKEENERRQVDELAREYPVWVSDIPSLTAALNMIVMVGELTGRSTAARDLVRRISTQFDLLSESFQRPHATALRPHAAASHPPRTAYFIWRKPWMVAGGGTFIHDMLTRCGFDNLFREQARYPSIDPASLAGMGCELVLLSSEPYPFRDPHIEEIREMIPRAEIRLVDGEMFSWYGSRLLEAPDYFSNLIAGLHP